MRYRQDAEFNLRASDGFTVFAQDNRESRLLSNRTGLASANRDLVVDMVQGAPVVEGVYSSDVKRADARVPLRHAGIWVRACLVCS